MEQAKSITSFGKKEVRRHWDEKNEEWYFAIIDIVAVLTESKRPRKYWNDLKKKLEEEGSELSEKIGQLKMVAPDGKMRLTDVADTKQLFRIIQSIPSPKVEPLKIWLAKVGYERIQETEDPEQSIDRAVRTYREKGYSKEWINRRIKSIDIRKELTDEWQERGVKEREFGILTNIITKAWSDKTIKEYKEHKGLKKQNLRDNMTNIELVLNMLAEASTTEISKKKKPDNFTENKRVACLGGHVAKIAKAEIEEKTGEKIVSPQNTDDLMLEDADKISKELGEGE